MQTVADLATSPEISGTKIIQQEPTREESTTTATTLTTDKPEVQTKDDLAASPEIYALYKNLMKAYRKQVLASAMHKLFKQLLENAMHKFFDMA